MVVVLKTRLIITAIHNFSSFEIKPEEKIQA